jgi:hypothetical protein
VPDTPLTDPKLRTALAAGLDAPQSERTLQLARYLARAFGPSALALLHYGSHATRSDARPESAHDFFVIVGDYRSAYTSLAATAGTHYPPGRAARLNRILAPNVLAIADRSVNPPLLAKIAVLSLADFQRECSAHAPDHFVLGRLFQPAALVWARDEASRAVVVQSVLQARAASFVWGRPHLPPRFDVETYCRTLLSTSFAAEIRPEHMDRVTALLDAQRPTILPMYAALLAWLAQEGGGGVLERKGGSFADTQRPGRWGRFRSSLYFRRSKLRATLRWVKYIALYDDWLGYVVQKVERRSGVSIELSPRERRWPLIFLWPKAIRFLRTRPQRQD